MATAPQTAHDHHIVKRHLPNALTLARLGMAVAFVITLSGTTWTDERYPGTGERQSTWLIAAAALFVIAAITDALDGILARRWNVVSVFGRVMDPFADKLLVLGAFVLLAGPAFSFAGIQVSGVQPWMVVVILGRELLVTSLRGAVEARGVDFSATTSGKLKMVLQSVCVPLVLVILALADPAQLASEGISARFALAELLTASPGRAVILLIVWLTVLITAWSGVPYIIRAWRAMRA